MRKNLILTIIFTVFVLLYILIKYNKIKREKENIFDKQVVYHCMGCCAPQTIIEFKSSNKELTKLIEEYQKNKKEKEKNR